GRVAYRLQHADAGCRDHLFGDPWRGSGAVPRGEGARGRVATVVRILHVLADLDRRKGGPAAACLGMANLMVRRGHDVHIVTTDRGYEPMHNGAASGLEIDALPGSWP